MKITRCSIASLFSWRKASTLGLAILALGFLVNSTASEEDPSTASEEDPCLKQEYASACNGPFKGGRRPTQEELDDTLRKHRLWHQPWTYRWMEAWSIGEVMPAGTQANLCEADLTNADLRRHELSRADLSGAKLEGATFEGALLLEADLHEANLHKSVLNGALLVGANLHGANLSEANVQGATIIGANLNKACLRDANLFAVNTNTLLHYTESYSRLGGHPMLLRGDGEAQQRPHQYLRDVLRRSGWEPPINVQDITKRLRSNITKETQSGWSSLVKLRAANIEGADLSLAQLMDADLRGARITNAMLRGVNLSGADLGGAELEKAVLTDASLAKANLGVYTWKTRSWAGVEQIHRAPTKLQGAILTNANLGNANLMEASLERAILTNANLANANLMNASLDGADLQRADLHGANLNRSALRGALLAEAIMTYASLKGAKLDENTSLADKWKLVHAIVNGIGMPIDLAKEDLSEARLSEARLVGVGLRDADLGYTDMSDVTYEPASGIPLIDKVSRSRGLETMRFDDVPQGLVELREAFKIRGYRQQERQITYAIKRTERENAWHQGGKMEAAVLWLLFEVTCDYGLSPGRPINWLLGLLFGFSAAYWLGLRTGYVRGGIWVLWPVLYKRNRGTPPLGNRVGAHRVIYGKEGEYYRYQLRARSSRLRARSSRQRTNEEIRLVRIAVYYSLISAFHFGWRELNVGSWISRTQKKPYTLNANGWFRALSGIQSIISIYLLALAILTYFGRPFE